MCFPDSVFRYFSLKAETFHAITAFVKGNDEVAHYVWITLEESQVLPTLPLDGQRRGQVPCGPRSVFHVEWRGGRCNENPFHLTAKIVFFSSPRTSFAQKEEENTSECFLFWELVVSFAAELSFVFLY
jgi:hypothetical protein